MDLQAIVCDIIHESQLVNLEPPSEAAAATVALVFHQPSKRSDLLLRSLVPFHKAKGYIVHTPTRVSPSWSVSVESEEVIEQSFVLKGNISVTKDSLFRNSKLSR